MTIAAVPGPADRRDKVTVRSGAARASRCLPAISAAGGPWRGSTPAPTRWTVRSSRASAGASSNARQTGDETPWGTVLAYEPPHRLAFSWIGSAPAEQAQPVEIRFTAEERGTRVELTHSRWEKLGDAATSLRERYERGSGTVFEHHFVESANSSAT